jgi:glycerol-3-phosphate acyltransferase PlsX
MFLGLQGVCVKSHGGTDATGFANAICVAVDLVTRGFNEKIKEEVARLNSAPAPDAAPPSPASPQASPTAAPEAPVIPDSKAAAL